MRQVVVFLNMHTKFRENSLLHLSHIVKWPLDNRRPVSWSWVQPPDGPSTKVFKKLVRSCYNPGQNYLRIFTPPCTLSNATTLFQQQVICGTKFPSPQVNVVSYKCLRIRVALEHTTTLLPGGGGKGGRRIARMLAKMVWECDIFSTVLSKIVAVNPVSQFRWSRHWALTLRRWPCLLHPCTSVERGGVKEPVTLFEKSRGFRPRCHGLSDLCRHRSG